MTARVGRTPRSSWTWSDTWSLELRSLGWFLGATLPISLLATSGVAQLSGVGTVDGWQVAGLAAWIVLIEGVAATPAVVVMLVALPVTMLLGLAMRSVRAPTLHVIVMTALAGTIAAVSVAALPGLLVFSAPVGIAAGAAAALARNGQFRRARSRATDRLVDVDVDVAAAATD